MPHGLSVPTDAIWPLREQTKTSHMCKSLSGEAAVGRPSLLVSPSGHRPQWAHLPGPVTEAGDAGQGPQPRGAQPVGETDMSRRKGAVEGQSLHVQKVGGLTRHMRGGSPCSHAWGRAHALRPQPCLRRPSCPCEQ